MRRIILGTAGVILLANLPLAAWLGLYYRGWHAEQPAIRTVRESGGWVQTTYTGPDWVLEDLLGYWYRPLHPVIDYLERVEVVRFSSTMGDAEAPCLEQLEDFCWLDLAASQITGAGLVHVGRCRSLQRLQLGRTHLHYDGLDIPAFCRSDGAERISDEGLAHLAGLTNLRVLDLTGTGVTDAGLSRLKNLPHLECLYLGQTRVAGFGLSILKDTPALAVLVLRDTAITDESLAYLAAAAHLQYLDLAGTQITDAGLRHLKGLASLQTLVLTGTTASTSGLTQLRNALPSLTTVEP